MDFMLRRSEAETEYVRITKDSEDPDLSKGNLRFGDYKYPGSRISEEKTFKQNIQKNLNV